MTKLAIQRTLIYSMGAETGQSVTFSTFAGDTTIEWLIILTLWACPWVTQMTTEVLARIDLGFANKVDWVGKFINIDSTKNAMTTHFHLQPLSGHYPLSSFDAIAFYILWLCVCSVPFSIMLVSSSTFSCLLCLSMQTSLSIYLPFYPIKWLFPIHL